MPNQVVIDALQVNDGIQTVEVDLGSTAENVRYGADSNVKTALDNRIEKGYQVDNFYGECTTAAGEPEKTVSLFNGDNFSLRIGVEILIKCSYTNTANNPTLRVGGTPAKPILYNTSMVESSQVGVVTVAGRYIKYVYDGQYWVWCGQSADVNTTYTNASLGQGYGTCSTDAATVAKIATVDNYALSTGGIVTIKFTNAVPADATLNINSKGAKPIYFRGAAIVANIIGAGDTVTFMYNGNQYVVISIDVNTQQLITNSINNLDKASVGGSGKYISAISQTNGLITATATSLLSTPTSGSAVPITSGGVYTALTNLKLDAVGGAGKYITTIKQTNGKVTATEGTLSTAVASLFAIGNEESSAVTIAANDTKEITHTPAKTGYKALGLVGIDVNNASSGGQGASYINIIGFGRTVNGTIYVQVRNTMSATTAKIQIMFRILYVKNS